MSDETSKDTVDYDYLSDNERYADLFNGALFGGERVLDAYDIMMVHAHSKELRQLRGKIKKEGGNVCKGLADWAAEEREEGRAEGRAEGALLQVYKMVERGRITMQEALEDLETEISENEFVAGMRAAGFQVP